MLLLSIDIAIHSFRLVTMENYTIFIFYIWKHLKKYMLKTAHVKHLEMQTHQEFWAREKPNNPISSASYLRVLLKYILFTM